MAFEVKDNSGSMFPNDRKESANHPDAKGSAMIDGVEYWISGWNKKTQEGKSWRSLSFTRKDTQQQRAPERKPSHDAARARQLAPQRMTYGDAHSKSEGSAFDGMDSDIPF